MTINIMLHCRDGIVLGCDSLGSMIRPMLIPGSGAPIINRQTGQPLLHPETNDPIIDVKTMKQTNVVVNTLGYENKLIPIKDYPVAMLTSGIGMLGKRSIEDLIGEFSFGLPEYEKVKSDFKVINLIKKLQIYIQKLYSENFKSLPKMQTGPHLKLLIGGYSINGNFGEIYRLNCPKNELKRFNNLDNPYCMTTAGQDDVVERFVNGMEERTLKNIINGILSKVNSMLKKMEQHTRVHIFNELRRQKIKFNKKSISPTPVLRIEEKFPLALSVYNIPFGLFSIQNAVDFVTFLINITYGRQRFVMGIPTVGGDVKMAFISKHEGLQNLTSQKIDVNII